ncbi:hypothetical protein GRX03_11365 [Halovenus sp. WSH3]|uniref:DUF7974 domain-containing protein n=1 Tax=Halovenus carboxidivorans TaxID=2692199 RepID=A0A6B0T5H0_9EURY|nr:hypothetical protein [Halovenus carboxidivorans]MXR52197.1 hypothetical protein [Halovenus carboxidivorans]
MRRIYESEAVDRSDGDPFRPNSRENGEKPQAARTLPQRLLSRWLVPQRVHRRAVSISIETPDSTYEEGEPVPISIQMHNRMPFPVAVRTVSPVRWTWAIDGQRQTPKPPSGAETALFEFDRGERKRFSRRWTQMFQVNDSEWEPAAPGKYTISAALNVDNPDSRALSAETTIRIE